MATKSNKKKTKITPSVVWFEIPADKPERARRFYSSLFGWKLNPLPTMSNYWHIDTGGPDASPDGGMMKRMDPRQGVTNYISVASASQAAGRARKLGGTICVPKTAVPGMGYFVVCQDPEGNPFALWEKDAQAK